MVTATPSRISKCVSIGKAATGSSEGIGASSITVTQVSPSRVLQNVTVGRMKSAFAEVSNGTDPNMMGPTPIGTLSGERSIWLNNVLALLACKRALMPTPAKPTPSRTNKKPFAPATSFRSISRSVICASGNDVAFIGGAIALLRALTV